MAVAYMPAINDNRAGEPTGLVAKAFAYRTDEAVRRSM